MLLKVALALSLGSLGLFVLHYLRESEEDEVMLTQEIREQLATLRQHLFSA
jgi:hypothetical protein